jgi:hypothetical protein
MATLRSFGNIRPATILRDMGRSWDRLVQLSLRAQIGRRRGDTAYEIKVRRVKAERGDADDQPTIVKTVGGVAHFFHNGLPACRNKLAFQTLWRWTIVKMACGFFHNGPAACTMLRRVLAGLETRLFLGFRWIYVYFRRMRLQQRHFVEGSHAKAQRGIHDGYDLELVTITFCVFASLRELFHGIEG